MNAAVAIGILCIQGDYEAHGRVFDRLHVAWRDVRRTRDLDGLVGLVLPGGESTTMWHFLHQDGFGAAIGDFAHRGGAVYGTCAGAILLARHISNPDGRGLDLLDIDIERNGYGRQVESAVRRAVLEDVDGIDAAAGEEIEAVLIRAPRIRRLGASVRVRARLHGDPVWVEAGRIQATTFHPELGLEERPHRRFLAHAAEAATALAVGSGR